MKGNEQNALKLLAKGASTSVRETSKRTALHWAAENCRSCELVQSLIDHGADVNAGPEIFRNHSTALHLAAQSGRVDQVKVLLAAGANRDIQDSDGKTAREVAIVTEKKLKEQGYVSEDYTGFQEIVTALSQ